MPGLSMVQISMHPSTKEYLLVSSHPLLSNSRKVFIRLEPHLGEMCPQCGRGTVSKDNQLELLSTNQFSDRELVGSEMASFRQTTQQ